MLAEGEEEVGSDNLEAFVTKHAKRLACDYVVISDSSMFAPGLPSILSSLRGLAYFQIDLEGPASDLHSGSYGGAVVNPAMALARILATFFDANGRIAIPGFYDKVREWDPKIRAQIKALPFDEATFKKEVGVDRARRRGGLLHARAPLVASHLRGERTAQRLHGARARRPCLPSKAMAKVSCRLVADQNPAEIEKLMREHIARVAPAGVKVSVQMLHGGQPWSAELEGPLVRRREACAQCRVRPRSRRHW